MISRVTQQSAQRSVLANMQKNLSAMAKLQEQASSGKKIAKVSDDPARASDSMSLRAERAATQQYTRNAQDGLSWLNVIDSSLTSTASMLRRARDLTVQGSNLGTMSAQAREAVAAEIDGIKAGIMEQANTQYLGRSVFAGTSSAGHAFEDTGTGYAFTGAAGTSVERRIAADVTVRVDADGASVFGDPTETDPASPTTTSLCSLTTLRTRYAPVVTRNQRSTNWIHASTLFSTRPRQLVPAPTRWSQQFR